MFLPRLRIHLPAHITAHGNGGPACHPSCGDSCGGQLRGQLWGQLWGMGPRPWEAILPASCHCPGFSHLALFSLRSLTDKKPPASHRPSTRPSSDSAAPLPASPSAPAGLGPRTNTAPTQPASRLHSALPGRHARGAASPSLGRRCCSESRVPWRPEAEPRRPGQVSSWGRSPAFLFKRRGYEHLQSLAF